MSFSVDETLLVKCLRQVHPNCREILVKKYDCEPCAMTPGTNYTSDIFDVSVEFECDGRRLTEFMIFKVPYVHKLYKRMLRVGVNEKETHMYTVIVPKLMEISATLSALPKHYLLTESHVLVLENLTRSGYRLADKHLWNVDECAVLLEELAKLHAASVKLRQQHPSTLEPASIVTLFREDVVVPTVDTVYPYLMAILKAEDTSVSVLRKLARYKEQINHVSIYEMAHRVRDFSVLVHGNLKANNVLLKYDDSGRPIAAKILDYQTYLWKSPIFDLFYFFLLVVDCDVLERHGDQLIDSYLATLNDGLSSLSCECAYSKNEYDVDVEGSKLFQVFTLLFSSVLIIQECIPGLILCGDLMRVPSQEDVENIRKNKLFDGRFLKWFRYFEKRRYFD